MNALGFFVRRIAWQLGIRRERQRWGSVNRETQILSEAEDLLGRLAWRDVADIDELSGEYWQIRDIEDQQDKFRTETQNADKRNEELKGQFDTIHDLFDDKIDRLKSEKSEKMEKALDLMREIELLKDAKDATKRKFVVLKGKMKVLKKQDSDMTTEVDKTKGMMANLRDVFDNDQAAIVAKTAEISAVEEEIESLEKAIADEKAKAKSETAELQTEISRLSKLIAELSAKIGALENTKAEFYQTIGHYLSNNLESKDPKIVKVLKKYRSLGSKIGYFRRSIAYNQRLARRTAL